MNTVMGHRWYVVRTQPHSENKASVHLGRQGFETYLPRYLQEAASCPARRDRPGGVVSVLSLRCDR